MKTLTNPIARRVIFFALLLLAWQGLVWAKLWPEYIFPSPMGVGRALLRGLQNGSLLIGIVASLQRLLLGFAISAVLGIGLGLALGRNRLLNETLGSLILGLQALPSICWLPLALIWFGLSETAMIFVVVMGALFSITLAAEAGVKNTPPLYLRAAANMGAKGLNLYRWVILPAALPAIITGLKMGWSFAWRSLMAAELLYVSIGLGHLLTMGRELNDMSQVIAVMLVIIALGLLVDRLVFGKIEASARERWGL
ncbi:MAG TPA: ABC transporter permease [Thermoflexales bacterium]|nr:ABC transporter permease [Thermoflexales bacterium]HQW34081.1 ABC transporter permease [Thermoflexales bacterium]HQZ21864.1 ABC transporter permease [Thermoflexales bacterium]HQZ99635.1 ABC transporter permease [Thermoflexales bacterium]